MAMTDPDRKPTAEELSDELESLQEAGNEIRARIKDTIAELKDNAEQISVVTKQHAKIHKAPPDEN